MTLRSRSLKKKGKNTKKKMKNPMEANAPPKKIQKTQMMNTKNRCTGRNDVTTRECGDVTQPPPPMYTEYLLM